MRDLTVVIVIWGGYVRWLPELRDRLHAEGMSDRQVLLCVNGDPSVSADVWPDAHRTDLPARVTVGRARNQALALVRTPLVCFCDADDLPAPGALRALTDALHNSPDAALATGLAARLTEHGTVPYSWPPATAARRQPRWLRAARQWAFNHLSVTTGAIMRTDTLRAVGGFPDEDLAEDGMLGCVLAAAGPVIVLDQITREYRTHDAGLCQRGHTARRWRHAYRRQRQLLASNRQLGWYRHLARAYAPVHWSFARRLARVARHD
jgi:cellulose synthase/poly-beta-1,6-N-acetylglucosamine synthase-like glycosyltransferase